MQSGLKTARQLENLVQEVAGHINFSSNLKVYHSEHQKQLKTLYGNHGTKEIWALDYTYTHTHTHTHIYTHSMGMMELRKYGLPISHTRTHTHSHTHTHTHTHTHSHTHIHTHALPCCLLAPFLTLATRCLFSGRPDADQHGRRDQQVLTLESSSSQIDKCHKREHVWVAGSRNGANGIIPSTSKVRSHQ